ncbi:Response regulator [Gammaproteobacteria bacterium]
MSKEEKLKKVNIMIVDDIPDNLSILQEILYIKGYRILAFTRGMMALNAARNNPPDLILLDIKMPEMDGFEVCEHLKADPILKDIPVIFISALNDIADKVKAFAIGGMDYITKPFQSEEVQSRVENQLKIRFLQKELSVQNENLERLVEKRTAQLINAYKRLKELDQIKSGFLKMISHEIRTPINGVLGIGELIINQCADSEDIRLYRDLFQKSGDRLLDLIENATIIINLDQIPIKKDAIVSFFSVFNSVISSLPKILITIEQPIVSKIIWLHGNQELLKKSLEIMILIANCFSCKKHAASITLVDEEKLLRVRIDVDNLLLSDEQVDSFFEIGSTVRSTSAAELLGLLPVVAHKIIGSAPINRIE